MTAQKTMGKDLRPSPRVWRWIASVAFTVEIAGLRRECALGFFCQGRKTHRVVHGDVCQHLAVQGDASLQHAVHETAVAQAIDAGSRIDAGDPQRTEVALLLLTTDVCVLTSLDDVLLGDAEDLATGVVVALRAAENLLVTAACLHTTFDSCHCSVLRDTEAYDPDAWSLRHE